MAGLSHSSATVALQDEVGMSEPANTVPSSIELRIDDISQLFHTLDPFPFREKDLDKDAEEFIVSWAREAPPDQPLRILVHLPQAQAELAEAQVLPAALNHYFNYCAEVATRDLRELFRLGRRTLVIGLVVLSLSIAGNQFAASLHPTPLSYLAQQSLTIFGSVANWRPMEIFLYDWLPIVRRRKLFRRLSKAQVELRPYPA
jgi:hypothetical protein